MTLEYYCKSRIRELLDALDDAIYDHATTRYLELSARLQEVARMRHMVIDAETLKDDSDDRFLRSRLLVQL